MSTSSQASSPDTRTANTIVVGVDGSSAATGAVAYAARTASARNLPLTIVTTYTMPSTLFAEGMVPPQSVYDELETQSQPIVDEAIAHALNVAPGITVRGEVVEGSPAQALIEFSRGALMVVLGSRGLGGIKGMVLGSVSAAVASHAHSPVVVTRTDTEGITGSGPVVVGIDGSEVSTKATEWAFSEASARGTTLIAVHTWLDPQVQAAAAGIVLSDADWSQLEQQQLGVLSERLAGFSSDYPDVTVERIVSRDRAVRALVEASEGAQLVVVGSHGRGGFSGMVLGSTSRALLQAAPCPVMVVRPQVEN